LLQVTPNPRIACTPHHHLLNNDQEGVVEKDNGKGVGGDTRKTRCFVEKDGRCFANAVGVKQQNVSKEFAEHVSQRSPPDPHHTGKKLLALRGSSSSSAGQLWSCSCKIEFGSFIFVGPVKSANFAE